MASLTSAINVQVDTKTKEEATNILKDLGISMSTAINIFLRQVIKRDGLPFEVINKPSEKTLHALKAAEDIEKHPDKYPSYTNREDLKRALLSDD